MTVETDMYSVLSAIVPTSADVAPDGTTPPYCIYSIVTGVPNNALEGGVPSHYQTRFQIDVHASTRLEASSIAKTIADTLSALTTPFKGYVIDRRSVYENEVKLYRTMIDFEVMA